MSYPVKNEIDKELLLEDLANFLEVSPSTKEKASNRYTSLGEWLERDESIIKSFAPKIYPQGSTLLGTAIKPLNEEDEYDLDAVCVLEKLNVTMATQETIKTLVSQEIRKYVKANNFKKDMEEGKRCLTIQYADSEQFHMDILPAVPDEEGFVFYLNENSIINHNNLHVKDAISITDNTLANFKIIDPNWNKSNPKGYSNWFEEQCKKTKAIKFKNGLFAAMESVEEIPVHMNKKILQKAIMILKSHRDNMYKDDSNSEHKPISIIITTLAAKAYDGSISLSEALTTITNNMDSFIEHDGHKFIINNPVNPLENFADKWEHEPIKQKEFYKWMEYIKADFTNFISDLTITKMLNNKSTFQNKFGVDAINEVYEKNQILSSEKIKIKDTLLSLPHVKKPFWNMKNLLGYNKSKKIHITCKAYRNSFSSRSLTSNDYIEKHWDLKFKVNFPKELKQKGLKYYWQVVNSGEEATNAHCLRGQIEDAEYKNGTKSGKSWEESTVYVGHHFVRCFLVVNGECIEQSEPFLVNIKEGIL